jgi:hypothetical protein
LIGAHDGGHDRRNIPFENQVGVATQVWLGGGGAEHRFFGHQREAWDRNSGISPLHHFSGGSLHRAIDTTETTIMIFLYGHPVAESVRKWETPEVFSKALAPSSA